jgi:hypothetical protein
MALSSTRRYAGSEVAVTRVLMAKGNVCKILGEPVHKSSHMNLHVIL